MTMPDLDFLNNLANELYGENFTTPDEERVTKPPLGTREQYLTPPKTSDVKLGSVTEPRFTSSPSYYFITNKFPVPGNERSTNASKAPVYDSHNIRKDFPILKQQINGKPLVWFDNAATTQKPITVIDTLTRFYQETNSNVHRGVHTLADRATDAYEKARAKVQEFLGASTAEEVIFVRGTTEAINLVAQAYGRMVMQSGDEVLLSEMEHHSNIIPWQLLAQATGTTVHAFSITDRGEVDFEAYERLLSRRPKIVAITQVSNVLGTINPVRLMIEMAHHYGACVLVDGAQAVPHLPINVKELDADFYAFSGHKTYGPTGIGVLYGKKALLEEMPPWQGGGSMIKTVSFEEATYNYLPHKFEAGTGNIADAVGMGAAVNYLQKIGMSQIEQHEHTLTSHAMRLLSELPGITLIGNAPNKAGVIAFNIAGIPADKIARQLDREGIAVRAGHHCAQPLLRRYGLKETVRVSLGLYNTKDEIDLLVQTLKQLIRVSR